MALFGELSYCVSHQITCCLHHPTETKRKRVVLSAKPHARFFFFCSYLVVSIEYCLFDETETRAFLLYILYTAVINYSIISFLSLLGGPVVNIEKIVPCPIVRYKRRKWV